VGLQITMMMSSRSKSACKVLTSPATVGARQSFCSVLKEATHRLRRTNMHQTIFPSDDTPPGLPRPNSDLCQDPSTEAHHVDNARYCHLERGVSPNIGLHCIEVLIHIYIGVPLRNPREGGCAGAGGQTAQGSGARETLKPCTPHLGGTPNGSGQASCRR
jgi:hypothetical protein